MSIARAPWSHPPELHRASPAVRAGAALSLRKWRWYPRRESNAHVPLSESGALIPLGHGGWDDGGGGYRSSEADQ